MPPHRVNATTRRLVDARDFISLIDLCTKRVADAWTSHETRLSSGSRACPTLPVLRSQLRQGITIITSGSNAIVVLTQANGSENFGFGFVQRLPLSLLPKDS